MHNMKDQKEIMSHIHVLLHGIDPEAKAYLFGSRARGTATKDSDWDILILVNKKRVNLSDYDKYSFPLREYGWDINEVINPVIFTKSEWEANHFTEFNHNVQQDGIRI